MRAEKTDKHANPFHKEYGLFSNIHFVWNNMMKYQRYLYVLIPIGVICAPIMQYLWTFISKFVIDMITNESSRSNLLYLMLIFMAIQVIATMFNTYYNSEVWWRYIYIRFKLINEKNAKIMTVDFQHLENPDVMDCYQKAGNACNGNTIGIEGMERQIVDFLTSFSIVIVGLVILGTMNIFVMLFMILLAAINFAITNHTNALAKKKVWDPLALWWRKRDYMQRITTDFEAAKDIRMFNLRQWLTKKYSELNDIRYQAQKLNAKLWFAASSCSNILWALSQAAVYAWLIYSLVSGHLTIGNFNLYLVSSGTFFQYISALLNNISDLLARSREVDDFRSFLDFNIEDKGKVGKPVPAFKQYEFIFQNVSFRYPKAEKYALKNLSLTLKAGERLAVVGLNGAGKSTFIKLLLRLYEPTEGTIFLNGVDIQEYNKQSYYKIFSPVFQDVQLFAFPLAENVSMKSPEGTDKQKAEKCLIDAGFSEKLNSLANGINTEILKIIYDDGVDLSGGEKQKLAFARALYKDAPVVVLDEPTAALDALAEYNLYQDFDKLIGGKTAVYISHRLSSTQFCSNVAMFKDGEMIEYGTHKNLLEYNGEYAKMFQIQAQYYQ